MKRILALVLGGIVISCTPRTESGDTVGLVPASGEAVVSGTVQIVGSAPVNVQTVLQPESGGSIRLTGSLVEEIRQLSGAQVELRGALGPSPDPLASRQMAVTAYEVISVNGRPVVLGEIIEVDGERARLRTGAGEVIHLTGVPGGFRVGQKVWVQGPQSVIIQSYGTVRP